MKMSMFSAKKKIEVGDREYDVWVATTEEEKTQGLQGVKEMKPDEGMLFVYSNDGEIAFWMKDTEIPLDLVFINSDLEVVQVSKGEPMCEDLIECSSAMYVLEVNQESGIKVGEDVEIDCDDNKMHVLDQYGGIQMTIEGGERIFSRKNTKILVKYAEKAYESKLDKDYKALGSRLFKYLKVQDNNEPEYVDSPKE